MEHEFWHERWGDNRIAFHEGVPNELLVAHVDVLGRASATRGDGIHPDNGVVFVPLCGKSIDMLFLAERGYRVLGVELSEIAGRAFFEENDLAYTVSDDGPFRACVGDTVTILCGDVFGLDAARLDAVTAVYDRAALVALPDALRAQYAGHLQTVLPGDAPMLVITFQYRQEDMDGPPFSVSPDTVRALYGAERSVDILQTVRFEGDASPLVNRGLAQLEEHAVAVGPAGSA